MLMEHKCKLLLMIQVVMLCICLDLNALGQNTKAKELGSHSVQLIQAPKIAERREDGSPEIVKALVQEERIVLLLSGLMLFAGATTLRRKRSSDKEQTP